MDRRLAVGPLSFQPWQNVELPKPPFVSICRLGTRSRHKKLFGLLCRPLTSLPGPRLANSP